MVELMASDADGIGNRSALGDEVSIRNNAENMHCDIPLRSRTTYTHDGSAVPVSRVERVARRGRKNADGR